MHRYLDTLILLSTALYLSRVSDIFEMINKGPMGYIFERQGGMFFGFAFFASNPMFLNSNKKIF